jgi:hypothetical protein
VASVGFVADDCLSRLQTYHNIYKDVGSTPAGAVRGQAC